MLSLHRGKQLTRACLDQDLQSPCYHYIELNNSFKDVWIKTFNHLMLSLHKAKQLTRARLDQDLQSPCAAAMLPSARAVNTHRYSQRRSTTTSPNDVFNKLHFTSQKLLKQK